LIPFNHLEKNRLNKALFFFTKLKLAHCKEAIRDLQSTESHAVLEKKFKKIFKKDLLESKLKTSLENIPEKLYSLGLYYEAL